MTPPDPCFRAADRPAGPERTERRRGWTNAVAAAAILAGLGGCVAFEHSPVESATCDPDLPGTWNLKAQGVAKTLRIDARCHTEDWPGLHEQPTALDLTGFSLGRDRYIVLSPADAQRAIGAQGESLVKAAPAGSVFVILYRIENGRASAWLPDSQRVLAAIATGELNGRKLDEKFPLVQGSAQAIRDTLSQHGALLYNTEANKAMVLERVLAPASKDSP
ncbi:MULTISPECIES: hypothetical protein [Lysobacter]|uniref:Lipoprotein n=1 Tax=Lysobacter gummosus TaxID=262324 RepID=A0ABY3XIG5_9GAMM|nr:MULTISPECIES: hypothetical protein [Lysobacter]ALN90986.1 hypothetical protein LG3211_2017 [Lysobacter gummosus]UJB17301.1 hypothetical protein L1A79_12965 [Lysobacter capsici]UJQ28976.1 hypothetical protein L2D09_01900 [Lysobacter gummosus]UNP31426.1 hypothetical protein MOV92_09370 [Lysobacter gummosus]